MYKLFVAAIASQPLSVVRIKMSFPMIIEGVQTKFTCESCYAVHDSFGRLMRHMGGLHSHFMRTRYENLSTCQCGMSFPTEVGNIVDCDIKITVLYWIGSSCGAQR